jgi:hypothetical protein
MARRRHHRKHYGRHHRRHYKGLFHEGNQLTFLGVAVAAGTGMILAQWAQSLFPIPPIVPPNMPLLPG